LRDGRPALAVATLLVFVAAAARILDRGAAVFPDLQLSADQSPEAWEPVLVAGAGLCIAGLTLRRSPWLAWFSTGLAAALGAIDLMGMVRDQLGAAAGSAAPTLVAISVAAAIAAAGVTTMFALTAADGRGPRRSATKLAAGAGFTLVGTLQAAVLVRAVVAAAGSIPWDPIPWIRVANRGTLGLLAVDLAVAVFLVITPRAQRAWAKSAGRAVAGRAAGRPEPSLLGALADEFLPGLRSRADLAAASERERLAADLHARVLPELRRAASVSAEGGASTADVRGALDDIETLMAERHSVVLEEFGLLAGLEWIAERTTTRAGVPVEIDVDDGSQATRPPRAVERAAFRVALLAMDNASRHARATSIAISVNVSSTVVLVAIADNGVGIDIAAADAARRDGHRGLSDMEAAASTVGASLAVSGQDGDSGTKVTFAWVAR
jgi:signal transduction histidine kinase